jgi:predicted O-linked N-acetylglucosamine transferase (SPINDLY family)
MAALFAAESDDRTGRESGNLCGMDESTVRAMLEQHFEHAGVARETIYFAEGWEPPEWRAQ